MSLKSVTDGEGIRDTPKRINDNIPQIGMGENYEYNSKMERRACHETHQVLKVDSRWGGDASRRQPFPADRKRDRGEASGT